MAGKASGTVRVKTGHYAPTVHLPDGGAYLLTLPGADVKRPRGGGVRPAQSNPNLRESRVEGLLNYCRVKYSTVLGVGKFDAK